MNETAMIPSRPRLGAELVLFGCLLLTYASFFQAGGWNQNARFAQIRAVVEEGRWSINTWINTTGDWTRHGDLFYPNKAPGMTLLGLPLHALAVRLGGGPFAPLPDPGTADFITLHLIFHALVALTSGLALTTAVALVPSLLRRWGWGTERDRFLTAAALGLATPLFPYATLFNGHAVSAAANLIVLWLIGVSRRPLPLLGAGLVAGVSILVDYPQAIIAGLFLLRLAVPERPAVAGASPPAARWDWRAPVLFGLGLLPALLLLAWYQNHCFGSPWTTSYAGQNPQFAPGGATFQFPTLASVFGITIFPFRGLFSCAPVLVLGVVGFGLAWRNRQHRAELILLIAGVAFYFGLTASFIRWDGGRTVGPRYLAPILPFLILPAVFLFERYRRTALLFLAVSAVSMLAATTVGPEVPEEILQPMWRYFLPHFIRGTAGIPQQSLFAPEPPAAGDLLPWPRHAPLLFHLLLWAGGALLIGRWTSRSPEGARAG